MAFRKKVYRSIDELQDALDRGIEDSFDYTTDTWGSEQNLVSAYVWFSLSSQAGYAIASEARGRLSRGMTPAQIAEAERLVAEWEPNPSECEVYSDAANAP